MILIELPAPSGSGRHVVAVFGVGLVGTAVVHALRLSEIAQPLILPFSWKRPVQWRDDFDGIERGIHRLAPDLGPLVRLDVVWSAGVAGFQAQDENLEPEMLAYDAVINWVNNLRMIFSPVCIGFHLVSSAGGLFEGQRFVERATPPRPLRPYGHTKLRQEHLLSNLHTTTVSHIYRPSSVYGAGVVGGRAGLINTLIDNAKKHMPTRIFGGMDTLRDYVLSSDIGSFMARRISRPETTPGIHLLASGKPASMTEMLCIAQDVVGSPMYLKLEAQPSNANHITYRPSALPDDWRVTDLETGIRQIARQLSSTFESGMARRNMTV